MTQLFRTRLISRLAAAPAVGEHPDAATLTAFRERRLRAGNRTRVAQHLARCHTCRNVLALSAPVANAKRSGVAYPRAFRWGAALAASALLFCGVTSVQDGGLARQLTAVKVTQLRNDSADRQPKVSYAVAAIGKPGSSVVWRIRRSASGGVLESSTDMGRTWQRARLDRPFDAETVGYQGADVWVKSPGGATLLSRDAGSHWTAVQPKKAR